MTPQVRKIVTWVITALLTLLMLAAGIGKFIASSGEANHDTPNYFLVFSDAAWLPYMIGGLEALCGLMVAFVPKLRVPAALLIMIIMLGALYSHMQVEGDFSNAGGAIMGFVLAGLSIYMWKNYFKAFPPKLNNHN